MSIRSARAKLRRARTDFESATAALQQWQASALSLVTFSDPEFAVRGVAAQITADVSEDILIDAGRAVEGIASALDHIAWDAYLRAGNDPDAKAARSVYFPQTEKHLADSRWTAGLPAAVYSLFREMTMGTVEAGPLLPQLFALAAADKHRDFHIVGFTSQNSSMTMPTMPEGLTVVLGLAAGAVHLRQTLEPIPIGWAEWLAIPGDERVPYADAPDIPEVTVGVEIGVISDKGQLTFDSIAEVGIAVEKFINDYGSLAVTAAMPTPETPPLPSL